MRSTTFLAVGFCLAALSAAQAQVDSGLEVRMNPSASRAGSGTLLYPGGEYGRYVPELLTPGERGGPIMLHMPSRHRVTTGEVAAAAPRAKPKPQRVAAVAPPPPAPKATAPAPRQPAPQQQQQVPAGNPFGMPDYGSVFGGQAGAPKPAAAAPRPATPKPVETASAAPPPATEAGLTKRSMILFAKESADPAQGALGSIKFLASELNSAMTRSASRIELQAYGGNKGDKGSDARRMSLKRALAIRQILIDDGVSPDRIDVRAMGGVDDTGPTDRVDVFVRA